MRAFIEDIRRRDNRVDLYYSDGDKVTIAYDDYNRALGAILGADKEDVISDFGISEDEK